MLAPDANLVTDYLSKTARVEEGTLYCAAVSSFRTLQGTGLRNYLMIEKFCSLVLRRGLSRLIHVRLIAGDRREYERRASVLGRTGSEDSASKLLALWFKPFLRIYCSPDSGCSSPQRLARQRSGTHAVASCSSRSCVSNLTPRESFFSCACCIWRWYGLYGVVTECGALATASCWRSKGGAASRRCVLFRAPRRWIDGLTAPLLCVLTALVAMADERSEQADRRLAKSWRARAQACLGKR
jgi:hypothetical protein